MLKRNRDLAFAGGMWVFPGGRIDPEDFESAGIQPAQTQTARLTDQQLDDQQLDDLPLNDQQLRDRPLNEQDLERSAAVAAVREAREEANLFLQVADLKRWSHWTPPPETPKRFSTAFFIAPWRENSGEVTVDDGEIREHRWELPARVLELRAAGEVGLTPPTFITLSQLLRFGTVADVFAAAETRPFEHFATRIAVDGAEIIAMYHGDSGYDSGDPNLGGAKHRLRMATTWQYERDAQADE